MATKINNSTLNKSLYTNVKTEPVYSFVNTKNDTKNENILNIYNYRDQIIADTYLNINKGLLYLNDATSDYCFEMLDFLTAILDDETLDKVEENTNTIASKTSVDNTKTTTLNVNGKRGREESYGGFEQKCLDNIIECLNYGVPDTLHDFGKGRNGIFPNPFSARNFLEKASDFLKINYPNNNIANNDTLYQYYNSTPGMFEEKSKNAFLTDLCGKTENIYYYFNNQLPNGREDLKLISTLNESLPLFFNHIKEKEYKYCVIDACTDIQKEKDWSSQITTLRSLCNLWDPAGASSFSENDFTDGNGEIGLKLVLEKEKFIYEKNEYNIYNSVSIETNVSLYDVYDELLNKKCLEKDNILFKLRIGKTNSNSFIVFLKINEEYFPISSGGFSVNALSYGLSYIDNNFSKNIVEQITASKTQKSFPSKGNKFLLSQVFL